MRKLHLTDLNLTENQLSKTKKWLDKLCGNNTIQYIDKQNRKVSTSIQNVYNDLDIESTMTLGAFFISYVLKKLTHYNNWMNELLEETLLHYSSLPESETWNHSLCGIEAFLKCVGLTVYPNNSAEISNSTLFALTEKNGLGPFQECNGHTSILDFDNTVAPLLAKTLRNCRNKSIHEAEFEIDAQLGTPANNEYYSGGEDICFPLVRSTACLILLTLYYHYDKLYDIVVPKDVMEGTNKPDPWQLLDDTYLNGLDILQSSLISDIYKFADENATDEQKLRIIDVNVKRKDFDDEADNKSSEGTDEMVMEEITPTRLIGDPLKRLLLFVGEAGTGKSIMVAKLVKYCISEWRSAESDEQHLLPIRINLRNYNSVEFPDLLSHVSLAVTGYYANNLEKQAVVDECVQELLRNGNAVVFFDGLDEIKECNDFLEQLSKLIKRFPCYYVVTSRQQGMSEKLERLDGFETYVMCELSDQLIKEQLGYTSEVSLDAVQDDIQFRIDSNEALHRMARNPFQLMLIVKMFVESGSNIDYLNFRNRGGLFFEFVNLMAIREQNKNPDFSKENLERVLTFIADTMDLLESNGVSWNKLLDTNERQCAVFGGKSERLKEYINYAISIGMVCEEEEQFIFTHKSWQEYFQAMHYVNDLMNSEKQEVSIECIITSLYESSYDKARRLESVQMLQIIFEVLEQMQLRLPKQKKEIIDSINCRIIVRLLQIFHSDDISTLKILPVDNNKCLIEGSFGKINEALVLLSTAVSTLMSNTNVDYHVRDNRIFFRPKPYKLVEMLLMNQLTLYRRTHSDGYIDKETLIPIFTAVAQLGSSLLTNELCKPYWLKMWLLHIEDTSVILGQRYSDVIIRENEAELDKREVAAKSKTALISHILINIHNNPSFLLERIIELRDILVDKKLPKSVKIAGSLIAKLLSRISRYNGDRGLISIYERLMERQQTYSVKTAANEALLLMNDVHYMMEHYDFGYVFFIHKLFIDSLLQKAMDEHMIEFLLHLCKSIKGPALTIILNYMIQCNLAPDRIKELLSDPNNSVLNSNRYIANLLPPEDLPEWYVEKYYDKVVFNYILEERLREHGLKTETERFLKMRSLSKWRPVIVDKIDENGSYKRDFSDAVVLCTPSLSQVVLATELISTSIIGLYARLESIDQWFVVENCIPAEGYYVELLLKGTNQSLSRIGHITFTDDKSLAGIDYDFAISMGNLHIIRVCKVKNCNLLSGSIIPIGQRVVINRHFMTLLNISIHSYTSETSIVRLKAVNEHDNDTYAVPILGGIPLEGKVSFFLNKDCRMNPRSLRVESNTRNFDEKISNLTFICESNRGTCFASSMSPKIGLWVELAPSKYIRLRDVIPVQSIWSIRLDLQGRSIPLGGILIVSTGTDVQFCFYIINKTPNGDIFHVFVEEEQDEYLIQKAKSVFINGECYSLDKSHLRTKIHPQESTYLLFFNNLPSELKSIRGFKNCRLFYIQDVVNVFKFSSHRRFFVTSMIKYSFDHTSASIRIPQPQEELKGLYFRVNDGQKLFYVTNYQQNEDSTISIFIDKEFIVKDEGTLSFYKDSEGGQGVDIHFHNLMSLVHLAESSRYHSSLCDILIEECFDNHQLGSASLYKFFLDLDNATAYLRFYDMLNQEELKKHGHIFPNVCVTVSKTPISIRLFSPYQANLNNIVPSTLTERTNSYAKGIIDQYAQTDGLEIGMLVVLEKSGQIRPFHFWQRLSEYGFVNGVIIEYKNQKDYYIRSEVIRDDFYFVMKGGSLQRGDVVNFFPSVNASIKYSNNPIASNLQRVKSGLCKGIVKQINKNVEFWTITIYSIEKPTIIFEARVGKKLYNNHKKFFDSLNINDEIIYFYTSVRVNRINFAYIYIDENE
jgi:hypothetical protein